MPNEGKYKFKSFRLHHQPRTICLLLTLNMFSPFARDFLKPQLFERMDNLMKAVPPVVEDTWAGGHTKFDVFARRLKDISTKKSNSFQLFLNANQYQPHDISIKIEDGFIVIHAEHDVKPNMQGYNCRQFTRRCKIPDNIDPATLCSTFNKNGLLVVKANTKPRVSSPDEEVTIPIEIHGLSLSNEVGSHVEKANSLEESEMETSISNRVP